jgi:hypothetical protein
VHLNLHRMILLSQISFCTHMQPYTGITMNLHNVNCLMSSFARSVARNPFDWSHVIGSIPCSGWFRNMTSIMFLFTVLFWSCSCSCPLPPAHLMLMSSLELGQSAGLEERKFSRISKIRRQTHWLVLPLQSWQCHNLFPLLLWLDCRLLMDCTQVP